MTVIDVRITVASNGAILGHAPNGVPRGEHVVTFTLPTPQHPPGMPSILDDLPSHDMGWDESISLRREDMYGDDGR